jgi:hypothetical protein
LESRLAAVSKRARTTRRAAAALIACLVVVTSATAVASTKRIADPKGDNRAPEPGESVFDLRSVNAVAGTARVKFKIRAWNAAFKRKPFLVSIDMRAGGVHYVAGWNGSNYAVHKGSHGEIAGALRVRRKSAHELKLSFATSALGGVHKFRWRIVAGQGCESCPASDRVPNHGSVTQRVG